MLEAARGKSQLPVVERARYVDPGLERLLCEVPKNTGSRGHR